MLVVLRAGCILDNRIVLSIIFVKFSNNRFKITTFALRIAHLTAKVEQPLIIGLKMTLKYLTPEKVQNFNKEII